jgi:hypothetical protein
MFVNAPPKGYISTGHCDELECHVCVHACADVYGFVIGYSSE